MYANVGAQFQNERVIRKLKVLVSDSSKVRFLILHECGAIKTVNQKIDFDYNVRQGSFRCQDREFDQVTILSS